MKLGAFIIENRFETSKIVENHFKYLPKEFEYIKFYNLNVRSIDDYNKLLTSKYFWEQIKFDKVLIFQHDSELLRNGIEEFYDYDYVGAPWKFQEHGGNGGLSFRSKEAMLWCIKNKPWNIYLGNEDVYFSNQLKNSPFKLAPREICKKFSCESIFELGTLGCHAIDKYLTIEQITKIKNQYE